MKQRDPLVTWQVAFTYVGALMGAGFASGQEILKFFVVYGWHGLLGTVSAGVLFAFFGWLIINTTVKNAAENYEQYFRYLFGRQMAKIFDIIIALFLFCGLAVMLVASGSLFAEIWGLPRWFGFLITAAVLYICLLLGLEGLLWLNTVLIPGIVLLCITIAIAVILGDEQATTVSVKQINLVSGNWFFASVLYVAYNLVLGTVVLSSLGKSAGPASGKGAIFGGIILGVLATIICLTLILRENQITGAEIPMLLLAKSLNTLAEGLYSYGLWAAILTTALGNGFGLLKRLENNLSLPKTLLILLMFFPTLLFVSWPLSSAVGIVYPLLGYIGLAFLAAILFKACNR